MCSLKECVKKRPSKGPHEVTADDKTLLRENNSLSVVFQKKERLAIGMIPDLIGIISKVSCQQ